MWLGYTPSSGSQMGFRKGKRLLRSSQVTNQVHPLGRTGVLVAGFNIKNKEKNQYPYRNVKVMG